MKKPKYPVGPRIASRRAERGISQAGLAEAVDMTQQGIQSIEAGTVKRPKKLREIAAALHSTETWLLDGKGAADLPSVIGFHEDQNPFEGERPRSGILEI